MGSQRLKRLVQVHPIEIPLLKLAGTAGASAGKH